MNRVYLDRRIIPIISCLYFTSVLMFPLRIVAVQLQFVHEQKNKGLIFNSIQGVMASNICIIIFRYTALYWFYAHL